MGKMNFEFTMNVKASVELTDEEIVQYKEWRAKNPNESPIDFKEVEEDALRGFGNLIESKVEILDKQCSIEE